MAEPALKEVANSIRESNRSSGQFRQAAVEGNKNMVKISKDLYSLFNVQRKENAGIINAINESSVETQQTGAKVDKSNALIQEAVTIQQNMLTELKNISIGLKTANDVLRLMAGLSLAGTDPSKIDPMSGVGRMLSSVGPKIGLGGLMFGGVGGVQSLDNTPNTNFTGQEKDAKAAAEKYIGRNLSPNEWSELVRATNAEAGRKNQTEIAMVMASILNRSRDKNKSIEEVLREKNQFTSVTGNGGMGVSAFHNAPGSERAGQIYGAATNILSGVDRKQVNFQAADPRAYDANGDGGRGEQKIQEKLSQGYSRVGASIFNTAPPTTAAQKIEGIPSGDIVALGKALQGQGLRVSEHPEFGGVDPVHKGKAHYEGRAIDINIGRGNVEANDPVMGERFDKLAEQLKAAGYKVIWRDKGHYDHIHVELGSGGGKGSESPASVSNQNDAPKPLDNSTAAGTPSKGSTATPQKPIEQPSGPGTTAFNNVFENSDSLWGGLSPKTILKDFIGTGMAIKKWFSPNEPTQLAPKPEDSNSTTQRKTQQTKAIQEVAAIEKVQEAKAQEAATAPRETSSTPVAEAQTTPANRQNPVSDYNGPNDVSIRGDGWTKDLLEYFGIIGKQT